MLVEGVGTHLMVGWIRLSEARSSGEWWGSPCIAPRCTPIGVLVMVVCRMKHIGTLHDCTGPRDAVLLVEGVDTHLMVWWIPLGGPILWRLAGVAMHRATVHTDRCTGRGCM